jgi:hypothetical protein
METACVQSLKSEPGLDAEACQSGQDRSGGVQKRKWWFESLKEYKTPESNL